MKLSFSSEREVSHGGRSSIGRNLRYAILVIFVVAAIVTPSSDILNMSLFAAPMVALYSISIAVAALPVCAVQRSSNETA